jgi:FAD/FMN-containing dehydrogenase
MVTANGSLVTTSEKENPNLFWGLRGAGGNFSIVVEAVYQVLGKCGQSGLCLLHE